MRQFLSLLILAACSGGGGGGDTGSTPREPFVPIVPITDPVPAGTATYNGGMSLGFLPPSGGEAVAISGDLSLTIDFDNPDRAITGAATGFADDVDTYTGNLLVNTAALDDSAGGLDFFTNINGSLLTGTTNYLVLGQMRGEFLGKAQEAASGQVSGQVQERGIPSLLTGQFQAARRP